MSPRAYARQGLPGPGQDRFPEDARETGRDLGLTGKATILKNEPIDDGGGALKSNWIGVETVRMRLDSIKTTMRGSQDLIADQIKEKGSHVASFDAGTDITPEHRLEVNGTIWIITVKLSQTDPLIERVGVREM